MDTITATTINAQPPNNNNKPYISGSYVDDLAEEEMFAAGNQQPPHPHHAFDLALHEDYPRLRQLQQASTAGDRTRGGLVSGIDDEEEDDDNDDYYDILSAGGMSAADRPSQQLKQKLSSASLSRPSMQSVITWLKANYEEYPGCNTSRENLFSEYSQFAQSQGMMIMNSASFGKLIRAVFPTIQTRRLGVRGQSKYHYNGIRPKPSTGNKDYLIDMPVGGSHMSAAELSPSAISTAGAIGRLSNSGESLPFSAITSSKRNRLEKSSGVSNGKKPTLKGSSTQSEISIPAFPPVPEQLFMENSNLSTEQIQAFIVALHKHYSALIGLVNKLNTDKIEMLMMDFWRENSSSPMLDLLSSPFMAKYICDCDIYVYSSILNGAHNESFADENCGVGQYEMLSIFFDGWVNASLSNVPDIVRVTKVQVAKCFTTSLRRAVSLLNNATQTRALLGSDYLLQQMVSDWSRLDSENINEFVAWACQWQEDFLFAVENDIVSLLHRRANISNWTTWLNSLIQRSVNFPMLHEAYDLSLAEHNSRQFVAKFAFFTSQILRDIAIRTVSSFGSYHTLRLFLDEYIWYMVTKNLSILKINHLSKMGIHQYPTWTNGILFYYLEQRHFFGAPISSVPPVNFHNHQSQQQQQVQQPSQYQQPLNVPHQFHSLEPPAMINHQVAPLPAPQSLNPNQNHQHLLNNNDHHQPQSLSCDLSQDAGSGGDKMIIGSGNAQNHSLLLQRSHSMEFMIDQTCGSDAAGNI